MGERSEKKIRNKENKCFVCVIRTFGVHYYSRPLFVSNYAAKISDNPNGRIMISSSDGIHFIRAILFYFFLSSFLCGKNIEVIKSFREKVRVVFLCAQTGKQHGNKNTFYIY